MRHTLLPDAALSGCSWNCSALYFRSSSAALRLKVWCGLSRQAAGVCQHWLAAARHKSRVTAGCAA